MSVSCLKAAGSVVGSVLGVLVEVLVVLVVVVLVTLEVVLEVVLSPSEHAPTTRRKAKMATNPLASVFNANTF